VYPEAPVFRDPERDLEMIGVSKLEFKKPEEAPQPSGRCAECLNKIAPPATTCSFCESLN